MFLLENVYENVSSSKILLGILYPNKNSKITLNNRNYFVKLSKNNSDTTIVDINTTKLEICFVSPKHYQPLRIPFGLTKKKCLQVKLELYKYTYF